MKEKIFDMLNEIRPEFDFADSSDFVEDGYLDSFDVVTLVSMIEEKFGVLISGMDILPENFSTVDAICELVVKNGGKNDN